jgi:hypothetical protein
MKKIVDYTFVTGNLVNMEDKVRQMIEDGWQPFGSVTITVLPSETILIQGMVKYEELTPSPYMQG